MEKDLKFSVDMDLNTFHSIFGSKGAPQHPPPPRAVFGEFFKKLYRRLAPSPTKILDQPSHTFIKLQPLLGVNLKKEELLKNYQT